MAGGQVICSDEEQHQHPGGVQRGRRTLCARIGAVSTCQGQEADSDIEQGQAKRKRDGDTAQREGHLLCSPFAYTHRPEFADKGQAFAKHLAARLSQQEEGSTANLDNLPRSSSLGPASPAAETQQPATEGPEYHSPASSRQRTPDQLSGRNLRMLEESTLNEPESEYVDRLKSLAQAARSLEMVMRSTAVRSAAESHRGCMDLEALMAMCVSDVKRALDKDRQGRKQLQAELRAATRAYRSVLPDRQAEGRAQVLQEECATLHAILAQQRSSVAAHLASAADQLQAERESHRIALEETTRQFIKERVEMQRRLQAQADEIARLMSSKPGSGVQP